MEQIIAVINQKGGVGKSTTAAALAAGLAARGKKVLAVDLDGQANLSFCFKADSDRPGSYELLTRAVRPLEAVQKTEAGDIIAAGPSLVGVDGTLTQTGKEYRLREALEAFRGLYDIVVIDTPPALGILTINALTACTNAVVPAQADIFSLQGIKQLSETIQAVQRYCNPGMKVDGILLTRYSPRTILSREVAEMADALALQLGATVFRSTIREAVAIREAQISQEHIFDYAPSAKVTADYNAFIDELLSSYGQERSRKHNTEDRGEHV